MYEPSVGWHRLTKRVPGFTSDAELTIDSASARFCCEPRIAEILGKAGLPAGHIVRFLSRWRDVVSKRRMLGIEPGEVEALGSHGPGVVLIRAGGVYGVAKADDLQPII